MIQVKQDLLAALGETLSGQFPDARIEPVFEVPKDAALGDLACTVAMQLAKAQKKNPRELAQALIERLRTQPAFVQWVESMAVAGPGFINLRLKPAAKQRVVAEVLAGGERFGTAQSAEARRLMVEFVSANPTGPLHVGHGRQAALGDAICNLFQAQGWAVHREFYYNDAGVQIANLALSTQARLKGFKPGDAQWPEQAYNGDYIVDIAADYRACKIVHADDREFTASGDIDDLDAIRQFAVAYLRREQDLDLQAFGLRFDHYYLESSLYASGRVERVVEQLRASGHTFEADGALWLRTTAFADLSGFGGPKADDKDRVMRKSDGSYTYFVPDVAYHQDKWQRGFARVINIQGTDHYSTIARVRAGLQALGAGVPSGYPDYVLHTMVRVEQGGKEVKISKRAGSYVTLRDLIEWTSSDAVRFFLLSRKADTEFVFDVDLAREQDSKNPVYYVQYAHARICSVIRTWVEERGGDEARLAQADHALLVEPAEMALMLKLAEYPGMLARAAAELAPHDVAFYLRDLAGAYHAYQHDVRFLVDDDALARARLALLLATRQVLGNALALLGVSAPRKM
ncbi:MAG TPA: arginine--tRNA ligase [Burkholderiaceae bacterium]|nr:arginine--tRNA ligase [Burkholderiaceae bacterium]